MTPARWTLAACAAASLLPLAACKTGDMGDAVSSASHTVAGATSSVPSLVNVDLSNVLNNLAVQLHLDRANVPINAQIPINIAANVCGVSINILSVSNGGHANCTAQTAPPELAQVVQQQLAAGGSVGGGAQGGSTATNGGTGTGGSGSTGASGTTGQSTGSTTTTPPPSGGTTTAPTTGTTTTPSTGPVQPVPTNPNSTAPQNPPPPPAGVAPPTDPSKPPQA